MIELVMHSNRGDVFGQQLKSHSRVTVCQPHFLLTEISAGVNHLVLVHGQIWSGFKISRKFLFEGLSCSHSHMISLARETSSSGKGQGLRRSRSK